MRIIFIFLRILHVTWALTQIQNIWVFFVQHLSQISSKIIKNKRCKIVLLLNKQQSSGHLKEEVKLFAKYF